MARVKPFSWVALKARRFIITLNATYHLKNGMFPVEIRSSLGLGAKLAWCLEIMAFCEVNGLVPQFKFSYPSSGKSEDYFSCFFSIKDLSPRDKPSRFITISSITELNLGEDYDNVLNFDLASYLIDKYLTIKEDVLDEVKNFCCRYFNNRRVLGVHYRGTDKLEESFIISYHNVKRNIERYLTLFPKTDCIFLSSDDINFIEFMEQSSAGRPVVYRDDSYRSRDGRPIHKSEHTDKYNINRDALVNCLLLSKCNALLKTPSILSGWSKLLNPQLPIVMLGRPHNGYQWFPERDLINMNLFEPIE